MTERGFHTVLTGFSWKSKGAVGVELCIVKNDHFLVIKRMGLVFGI